MKSIKQLLRQPLKTAVGIALMTLAATIVCLCVGQALAAQTTKAALDERFSTVGIPTIEVHITDPDTREDFRKISYIRQACITTIKGMGFAGYLKAMRILSSRIR